jgi:hypothetical protein
MSKFTNIQLLRGTTAQHDTAEYIGPSGELTVVTANSPSPSGQAWSLRVHDGAKKGGWPVGTAVAPATGDVIYRARFQLGSIVPPSTVGGLSSIFAATYGTPGGTMRIRATAMPQFGTDFMLEHIYFFPSDLATGVQYMTFVTPSLDTFASATPGSPYYKAYGNLAVGFTTSDNDRHQAHFCFSSNYYWNGTQPDNTLTSKAPSYRFAPLRIDLMIVKL